METQSETNTVSESKKPVRKPARQAKQPKDWNEFQQCKQGGDGVTPNPALALAERLEKQEAVASGWRCILLNRIDRDGFYREHKSLRRYALDVLGLSLASFKKRRRAGKHAWKHFEPKIEPLLADVASGKLELTNLPEVPSQEAFEQIERTLRRLPIEQTESLCNGVWARRVTADELRKMNPTPTQPKMVSKSETKMLNPGVPAANLEEHLQAMVEQSTVLGELATLVTTVQLAPAGAVPLSVARFRDEVADLYHKLGVALEPHLREPNAGRTREGHGLTEPS
jgi:hypothetical protein